MWSPLSFRRMEVSGSSGREPAVGFAMRLAALADLPDLVALKHAAYARNRVLLGVEPLPLQVDYAVVLADPRKEIWLAEGDGGLVGAMVVELRQDDLMIESIASAPAVQGQGLGRAMLEAAFRRADTLGRQVVRLYTGTLLTRLVAWYGRHGFEVERVEQLADRSITHMVRMAKPRSSNDDGHF